MKKLDRQKGFSAFELLIVLLVIGVIGVVGWYVYQRRTAPGVVTNVASKQSVSTFYYSDNTDKVFTYNLASGAKTTTTLPLTDSRYMTSVSAGVNNGVQIANSGSSIFYLSFKPVPGASTGGEGYPPIESTIISEYENKKETQLVEVKADGGQSILDWLVSPDGSRIYYLTQDPNKGKIDLHILDVGNKKDVTIKAGLADSGGINNPLFLTPDGTLLIYSAGSDSYGIIEHRVASDLTYSSKDLGTPCKCMFQFPQAVSPDGKKLLQVEQTNGTTPSDFTYYVFDTSNKKNSTIAKPATNIDWGQAIWAPDSKNIVYTTDSFSQDPSFIPQLTIMNTESKKSKNIVDQLTSKDSLNVLSWSPDGRYIVYAKNNDVEFYDVRAGKTIKSTISGEDFGVGNTSLGWY